MTETEEETIDTEPKTDAQIAREQGITRQAIGDRRQQGWTQEEIELGAREEPRKSRYETKIARDIGMSVAEKARKEGVSAAEIYRRYNADSKGKGEKKNKKPTT